MIISTDNDFTKKFIGNVTEDSSSGDNSENIKRSCDLSHPKIVKCEMKYDPRNRD